MACPENNNIQKFRKTTSKAIKSRAARNGVIGLALLPLSACGGGGSGPAGTLPPPPPPPPDFIENPTNTFVARDDNNRTLDQGAATSDLIVTGKGGNDTITTGSGADVIYGAGGNDTILSGAGADMIRGGEGADSISAGDGDDVIVVVGTTTAGQYTDADITNPAGSGLDMSRLITLADLNDRTVSEVVSGETIDGGAGNNTLYIYGTVDLTGVTISNVITMIVNSNVTLTQEQIAQFTTIDGDGNSVINIIVPDNAGDVILDLSVIDMTDVATINIQGDITIRVSSLDDVAGINQISIAQNNVITLDVTGGGNTSQVSLLAISEVFHQVDIINLASNVTLTVDAPEQVAELGLGEISGSGMLDVSGSSAAENILQTLVVDDGANVIFQLARISINDVTVNEADGIASFTVTLLQPATHIVSVNYMAPDGTSNILTFQPGEVEKTFTSAWADNGDVEPDIVQKALLYNPVGGYLKDSSGQLNIMDDDGLNALLVPEDNANFWQWDQPDGVVANAISLDIGQTVVGNIKDNNDHDFFRVNVEAGKVYFFDVDRGDEETGTLRNLLIKLYDDNGEELQWSDQLYTMSFEDRTAYYYTPKVSGDIYIDVNSSWSGDSGNYILTASEVIGTEPAGGLDYAADISTTASMTIDDSFTGNISDPGDKDFIAVQLEVGTYRFTVSREDDGEVPGLQLYDANGDSVTNSAYANEKSDGSRFRDFTVENNGTYYISVESGFWGNMGQYSLSYSELLTHEPDGLADYSDDTSTRGELEIGVAEDASFTGAQDNDWYAVTLTAGVIYQLDITDTRENTADRAYLTFEDLYDSQGNPLNVGSIQGGGVDENVRGQFTVSEDGVYYVSVKSNGPFDSTYNILLSELLSGEPDGGDDYANNITTRGILVVGDNVTGRMNPETTGEGNEYNIKGDWFKITLEAGKIYSFTQSGFEEGMGSQPYVSSPVIFDADGNRIYSTWWEGSGGTSVFAPTESGTYYVGVKGGTGTYTLSATEVNTNEPGGGIDVLNDTDTPALLNIGENYEGNLYSWKDSDWIKINLEADTLYQINISSNEGLYFSESLKIGLMDSLGSQEGAAIREIAIDENTGDISIIISVDSPADYFLTITSGARHNGDWKYAKGDYTVNFNEMTFTEPGGSQDYGNSYDNATAITENNTLTGELNYQSDTDWFSINLAAGEVWSFQVSGDTPYGFIIGEILSPSQEQAKVISRNFNDSINYNSTDYIYTIEATEAGTYYVEVKKFGTIGTYEILAKQVDREGANDLPADDTTPALMLVGDMYQTDISYPGDKDWIAIELEAGRIYEFTISEDSSTNEGVNFTPQLWQLRTADGGYLSNDSYSLKYIPGTDTLTEFTVLFIPQTSGVYYLPVGSDYSVGTGLINIASREIAALEPDGGQDFTWDTATRATLEINGLLTGNIGYKNDSDLVAVELVAGETYLFEAMKITSDIIIGGIFDAAYVDTGNARNIYNTTDSMIFTPTESGTYYVSVLNTVNNDTGSYALTYRLGGEDEPTGAQDILASAETPALLDMGDTFRGTIGDVNNQDWIAVTLEAGIIYQVSLTGKNDNGDLFNPAIDGLFDSNSNFIPGTENDNGGEALNSKLTFIVDEAGTYYIAVGGAYGDKGNYELSINELYQFSNGDDQLIMPGSTVGNYDFLAGDDLFEWNANSSNSGIINGGEGTDTIRLINDQPYGNLDWVLRDNFQNFEIIELSGTNPVQLDMTLGQIIDITDENNQIIIKGDEGDRFYSLYQDWILGEDQTIDGEVYHTYTSGDATLLVDVDISQSIS